MKMVIGKYNIDVNEDDIRKSRRSSWVGKRVKAFEWTGIDCIILQEKFTEIYDMIKGVTSEEEK